MRTVDYVGDNDDFERKLINAVCKKIETYIQQISPSHLLYIAFDGVAPVAKLDQQKNRRYKSWFINQYEKTGPSVWNSTAITPGTDFMNKLNLQVRYHFRKPSSFNVKQIVISGSDYPGEGEHKIFEYIRDNTKEMKEMKTVIYGLDADLIMLTINHLHYCENMYLFRETPDFIKSIDNSLDPNLMYVIDIPEFKTNLVYYLNNDTKPTSSVEHNRVFDYIFLCFLLGNDFLPHFPAVNLRTGGMEVLMETYRNVLGKTKKNIINDGKIVWKNLRLLLKELSEHEDAHIQADFKKRSKHEKRPVRIEENMSKFDKDMLHAPTKEREVEKYINPMEPFWESRYYDMLFDVDIDDDWRKRISLNYLEGLEWTWKYYSTGCVDWRWTYNYHYPPLLSDLLKYVPYFDTELVDEKEKNPVTEIVQLSYVLPKNSLYLLPKRIEARLTQKLGDMYREDYEFEWAYCKYFWECHVKYPVVKIDELENIVDEK
jgi:5'-3' exonuclease